MKIKHHYFILPVVDESKVLKAAKDNSDRGEPSMVHWHEEDSLCDLTRCRLFTK